MPMTKAQAIAELEHIYEILPLIAEAVKEEKKPINQYGKCAEVFPNGRHGKE